MADNQMSTADRALVAHADREIALARLAQRCEARRAAGAQWVVVALAARTADPRPRDDRWLEALAAWWNATVIVMPLEPERAAAVVPRVWRSLFDVGLIGWCAEDLATLTGASVLRQYTWSGPQAPPAVRSAVLYVRPRWTLLNVQISRSECLHFVNDVFAEVGDYLAPSTPLCMRASVGRRLEISLLVSECGPWR